MHIVALFHFVPTLLPTSVTFLCVSQDIFSSNGKSNGHGEIIEKSTVYPWIKIHNFLDEIWNIILLLLIVENYPPLPLK